MRNQLRSSLWMLAILAFLADAVAAQIVIEFTDDLEDTRPEAWAMKYFTAVSLLCGMGSPEERKPGSLELALEGGWVPSLSDEEQRTAFDGRTRDDLNKTSVFGRPRLTIGLPNKFSLS